MPNVIAFIGARGGSKGLPKKNLRLLAGEPLISYVIKDAKQAKLINRVIVATDDEEMANVAKKYGAEIPFLLPPELCVDHMKIELVVKYVIEELEKKENYKTDIVVYLQSTDFFRKPEWIDWCVQQLIDDPNLETAFTAQKTHKNFWQEVDGKLVRLRESDKHYVSRQIKVPLYKEDTGLASASRAWLFKQGLRTGDTVKILLYDEPFIDVHGEFDLWMAEKIMKEWKK